MEHQSSPDASARHRWREQPWGKFIVIGVTCFAQSFPLSIADRVLPPVARANGLTAEHFWLFSLMLIPLWGKILWAPLVDRLGSARWGRRKSVILPFTLLAAAMLVGLGLVEPGPTTITVAVGIFLCHALLMSAQDISVDAYTVENLLPAERPIGSAVKATFETIGALLAATSILAVNQWLGWFAAMSFAAGLLLTLTIPVLLRPEPPRVESEAGRPTLARFFKRPDLPPLAGLLFFAGAANAALATMASIFLVDAGLSLLTVGLITGTIYAASEFTGSLLAAILMARLGSRRVLALLAFATIPATLPLFALALGGRDVTLMSGGVAIALPALLLGGLHAVVTVERLGWSVGLQAGTDFTGFGTFYNLGRMSGVAVGGPILLAIGWSGYFAVFALFLAALAGAFAAFHPRLSATRPEPHIKASGVVPLT